LELLDFTPFGWWIFSGNLSVAVICGFGL